MKHVPWYLLVALAAGTATAQIPARPDPTDPAAREKQAQGERK